MLDLAQIESFYPEHLRPFRQNLLREYLQYKILEIIFETSQGTQLAFMGGTAIHILHGSARFSEDLDFDNLGLTEKDFGALAQEVQGQLKRQGYTVEIKNVFKKAFRCYLRFSGLLFENKLSGHRAEKLLIQLDTEPQRFRYKPEKLILNKFDVFLRIQAVPPDILLAQKIACIFKRPRPMGRDFYDTVFLLAKTQPNFAYLKMKLKIATAKALKQAFAERCRKLDFKALAKDVEPFLFDSHDGKKVLFFADYIQTCSFV